MHQHARRECAHDSDTRGDRADLQQPVMGCEIASVDFVLHIDLYDVA
jgi:hypothetical protein